MGEIQGIEPSTIHLLLGYQPRGGRGSHTGGSAGGSAGSEQLDAASEEAGLGTQGVFTHNK